MYNTNMNKKYLNIFILSVVITVLGIRLAFGDSIPPYFEVISLMVAGAYLALLIVSTFIFILVYLTINLLLKKGIKTKEETSTFIKSIKSLIENKDKSLRILTIVLSVLIVILAVKNGLYFLAILEIITEAFNMWVYTIDPESLNTED